VIDEAVVPLVELSSDDEELLDVVRISTVSPTAMSLTAAVAPSSVTVVALVIV
jgi:hypothetical protein